MWLGERSSTITCGLKYRSGEVWLVIATEQKPIELILARSLLDALSTPGCLIDLDGTLVYYNEAVGKLAGMSFEETGAMPAAEWTATFGPFDEAGERIPFEEHPLTVAVRGGRAGHFVQRFGNAEGGRLRGRSERRSPGRGHRLRGRDGLLLAGGRRMTGRPHR